MKKINIILAAVLALAGIAFTACDDDAVPQAKAVLCSVFQLNFGSNDAEGQEVKVVSDAEWHISECPEWVSVTPDHGSGTTFVTISVAPNYEGNTELNPRRGKLVFRGATKLSEAEVVIMQSGDAFYNVVPISIAEIEAKDNDQYVISNGLTVVAATTGGYIATDGTDFLNVKTTQSVEAGDVVSVLGQKQADSNGFVYVVAMEVNPSTEAASATPEATDITANLDSFKSNKYQMVKVNGIVDGNNISVTDMNYTVVATETSKDIKMSDYDGHMVNVTALYCGTAAPAVNVIVVSVEDLGVFETLYFKEDFEWLDDWAAGANVGRTVEENNLDATATALTSIKADVNGVSMTCYDYIESKGYTFVYDKGDNKRTYLQRNYLKFGKTGNHSGIILPSIETIPDGEKVVLSFDWCPMRQGSGKIDPVNLYVVVENDGDSMEIDVPTHNWEDGHVLEWIKATVDLSEVKVNKDTKITITQREWEVGTANRWFLDNIKITPKK